ncbi:hypothetical protein QFC19_007766 [Naganishia cerealis]|uniref:Uncharacterized protein n=1 Tax=Naganishia cerealis TaxID=610337 RepID=A0ACC2V700_9TREE|nr:hypothetical protein QFC19_007766 [Naganishia cerealis]
MDFDWAAWHKKFEDFGLSTRTEVKGDAKFPGSFPETEATGGSPGGEVNNKADEASSSSHGTGDRHLPESNRQQHSSNQGWKQEMEEEAADPVWKEHLDKLQATGKLEERSGQYSSTDAGLSSGVEQEKEEDIEAFKFSFDELQEMLTEAESLRKDGNELYKSGKDIDYEAALETYQRALSVLPETSISRARVEAKEEPSKDATSAEDAGEDSVSQQKIEIPSMKESGLVELTDEQAAALEQEEQRKRANDSSPPNDNQKDLMGSDDQVQELEGKIEEIKGFLYGNISAVQVALHKDTEAVEAASKSLLIDPQNAKVRLRRAKVNEKIGKFTSLSESLEDYKYLLATLPHNDSRLPQIRRAVALIPSRIEQAGKAEMEQMVTQMKEWGDSILGWFGMKCDDFKTETQPDGSTSININKSS